jgi:hypothetical protein
MRALIVWMCFGVSSLLMTGCAKEPGEGGKALIRGTVLMQDINNNTGQPTGAPYPAQEQKVYIVYGDGEFYDDDVDTGPAGEYEFRWLQKGTYRIFVYSETCATCNELDALSATVEIDDRKQVKDMPTFTVANW